MTRRRGIPRLRDATCAPERHPGHEERASRTQEKASRPCAPFIAPGTYGPDPATSLPSQKAFRVNRAGSMTNGDDFVGGVNGWRRGGVLMGADAESSTGRVRRGRDVRKPISVD